MGFKWVYSNPFGISGYAPVEAFQWNPVVGPDGTIYIESFGYSFGPPYTNELFALAPSGNLKWMEPLIGQFGPESGLKFGCITVASDEEIYVADTDGSLYSFAPNGTNNWAYNTGGYILNSPLIGPDGTLYVESGGGTGQGGIVYAFSIPAPVACGEWPEDGKNARRASAVQSAQLSLPDMTANGFQFTISASTNVPVCPCASQDLVNWTNIGQVVVTNGTANFTDNQSSNFADRFYRASPQ
jgi:hypothetical protein